MHIVVTLLVILLSCADIVIAASASTAPAPQPVPRQKKQPISAAAGLSDALSALRKGVSDAAATVITVPVQEYRRNGTTGAIKAVIRAIPVAILHPLIGTTEAVSKSLMGASRVLAHPRVNKRVMCHEYVALRMGGVLLASTAF
jgi:hypothetical protein